MYEVKRRRPSRHWFALLTCLLLLSLAAPTLWNDGRHTFSFDDSDDIALRDRVAARGDADVRSTIVVASTSGESPSRYATGKPPVSVSMDADGESRQPTVAASISSDPQDFGPKDSTTSGAPRGSILLRKVEVESEPAVGDQVQIGLPIIADRRLSVSLPAIEIDPSELRGHGRQELQQDPAPTLAHPNGWPAPLLLFRQLDALTDTAAAEWAVDTISTIEQLNSLAMTDTLSAGSLLRRLEQANGEAKELAEQIESPEVQTELRRVAYAVYRRASVWNLANEIFAHDANIENGIVPTTDELLPSDADSDEPQLPHLAVPMLTPGPVVGQQAFAHSQSRPFILEAEPETTQLSPPTAPPTSAGVEQISNLLVSLERYENTRQPADGKIVARHIADLSDSLDGDRQALAEHLDNHYRNANHRITITSRLLDELLPKMQTQEGEVSDRILGASVWGWQATETQLDTEFLEHPSAFRIRISALGTVSSDTQASKSSATIYSVGQTDFNVGKEVIISPLGVKMTPARAYADGYASFTDVETERSSVPLIGALTERIARNKYAEEKHAALAQVENRVARESRQRFEKELTPKIIEAAHRFHRELWTPLVTLGLDPTAVEMYTKPERMVARHRLGSAEQLAGHTSRPRAPSDSLASMQVHESLLNNALARFKLDGKTFTLPELHTHVSKKIAQPNAEIPEDFDKRVKIAFAEQDAIRIRCDNGEVELTLSLAEISRGKKHRWNDLIVKARYVPDGTGLQANLVRQDSIELIGEGLRTGDQIALRGVFSKLLSRSRYAVLVPKHIEEHKALGGLEVTHFSVTDGWVTVAIGPRLGTQGGADETAGVPRWRVGQTKSEESTR